MEEKEQTFGAMMSAARRAYEAKDFKNAAKLYDRAAELGALPADQRLARQLANDARARI